MTSTVARPLVQVRWVGHGWGVICETHGWDNVAWSSRNSAGHHAMGHVAAYHARRRVPSPT